MGYFANLYIVEANATERGVTTKTTIYGSQIGEAAYFCWGPGVRPGGLHSYAEGTVLCDTDLHLLPGYPHVENLELTNDQALIEANFQPRHGDDPVIFHFVLPNRFLPRRDLIPLDQPDKPFVYANGDRLVATYPTVGPTTIRFRISRLRGNESITDYAHDKLLSPELSQSSKIGFEFNLGVFKIKYG